MPEEKLHEIDVHIEKGSGFRVIHVDGAWGGLAPSGKYLTMNVFSERRPIPQKQLMLLDSRGAQKSEPEVKAGKSGIFREVEACLVFDETVARGIHDWLGNKLKAIDDIRKEISDADRATDSH